MCVALESIAMQTGDEVTFDPCMLDTHTFLSPEYQCLNITYCYWHKHCFILLLFLI